MAWTYTITIAGVGTVSVESMAQTLKIDESLDSALLVIPRVTRKAIYPRFSEVSIVVSDGTNTDSSYWVIYSDKVEVAAAGTTLRYDHTLGLIEPIKMLEKYSCGSLTFTQPLGGTRYTMFDVVERIRQLTPFKYLAVVSTTRKFTIDATLATELDLIDAPQFYLDKKNLREALIEVFKYINAIPRIRFTSIAGAWVLYADKINNWHLNITPNDEEEVELNAIDYTTEVSGEDYATATESYLENVIPSEDNEVANVITELVSFRNNNIILGDTDLRLILLHDVAELVSFTILADDDDGEIHDYDGSDYIFEKKVFDTLLLESGVGTQSEAVYWEYGTNEINGFGENYGLLGVTNAITEILSDISPGATNTTPSNVVFKVSYIPYLQSERVIQYREDISEIPQLKDEEAVMQVNQNERINALYNATNNIYGQVQRIGVDTMAYSKKHRTLHAYDSTHTDGIYSLGDYMNSGYIIVKVEKIFYNSFVVARYEASKNFNRIAQFIPISREFRAYEISLTKSDYTLKRDVLIPLYYVSVASSASGSHVSNALITPFMDTFMTGTFDVALQGALFRKGNENGTIDANGVYLPLVACAEKNTIKLKLDFRDTKLAGRKILYSNNMQVKYTEDDGTIEMMRIDLYHNLWAFASGYITDGIEEDTLVNLRKLADTFPFHNTSYTTLTNIFIDPFITATYYDYYAELYTDLATGWYVARDNNTIYSHTVGGGFSPEGYHVAEIVDEVFTVPIYQVMKDGAEILGVEMYLPIIPSSTEATTFIIGDSLSKDNCLIKQRGASKTLYFYGSTTRYTKANTSKLDTATRTATTVNAYVSGATITPPTAITTTYDYYAIGDYDGNMYLAVNQVNLEGIKTAVTTIAFNFLYER